MKKILLGILLCVLWYVQPRAQTTTTVNYNFESLNVGALNGQDNWKVYGAGGGSVVNAYASGSYSGSKAANITEYSGSTFSRVNNTNWSTPNLTCANTLTIEATMHRNYWYQMLSLAYDKNNDGDFGSNSSGYTFDDGEWGIGILQTTGKFGIVRADGSSVTVSHNLPNYQYFRYRLVVELTANNGTGAGSLSYRNLATGGDWIAIAGLQNITMNINNSATNAVNNLSLINGLFYHVDKDNGSLDDISISVTRNTPTISIAASPSTSVCTGTNVTFTATSSNVGGSPNYVWKRNGMQVATSTSNTYSSNALSQGDVITCELTSNASCLLASTVASNNLVMSVNPTPTLQISGNANGCGTVSLTATNNGSLNFQGSTSAPTYVSVPDANILDLTNAITLEAWVRPTSTAGYMGTIVSKNRAVGGDGYYLALHYNNGQATLGGGVNSHPANLYVSSSATVPLNTWSHVAFTFNGSVGTLYLNGVQVAQVTKDAFALANSTQPLCIGNAGAGLLDRSFLGEIDEVRVWNRVRTAAQLAADRSRGISAQPNLVAYYRLNEATGNTITDASGNGQTGTFVGNVTRVVASTSTSDPSTYSWSTGATTALATFTANATPSVTVTDANGCTATASPNVVVNQVVVPTLTIAASPGNTVTNGTNVTFSTTVTNAGTSPTYQWFRNGNVISGAVNATYSTNSLVTGDVITCRLTSSDICATPNQVTSTGITMTVNPRPGAALDFDGTNDYVEVPNSNSLNTYGSTGEITIEYWIKPVPNGFFNIISKRPTENTSGFVMEVDGGSGLNINHWFRSNSTWYTAQVVYDANVWQHIAVVAKSNDAIRVYKNGVLARTTSLSGQSLTTNTSVMRLMSNSRWVGDMGKGSLDEVRIWNRALPLCEIQNNMNTELGTNRAGLVAYYGFNHGVENANNAGVTALSDLSGNNNHGTLVNFTLTGTTSNWTGIGGVTTGTTAPTLLVPAVSIAVNPGSTVPANSSATFTATPTNGGTTPTYQWFRNGTAITNATNATYSTTTLVTGDVITCRMTSSVCTSPASAVSGGITMTVTASLTATSTPVCGLSNGTITPTVTASLSKVRFVRLNQNYNTSVNIAEIRVIEALTGVNVALNKNVTSNSLYSFPFPNSNFVDGNVNNYGHSRETGPPYTMEFVEIDLGAEYLVDMVQVVNRHDCCQYRSQNFQLILKNAAGVVVHSRQIDAYQGQNSGHTTSWNVTDVAWSDGGRSWNRTQLAAGDYTLTYSDEAGVSLSTNVTVTSNNVIPSVSIATTNSVVCVGATTTFTATPTNGGTTPAYQWKKNGQNVGTNSATYAATGLVNGDVITCVMTSNSCAATPAVTSPTITITTTQVPTVAPITAPESLGVGAEVQFSCATEGGVWSSSNPSLATVNSSGLVTGIGTGTVTINYAVTNSCGTTTVSKTVNITNTPKYCISYRPVRVGNYLYLHLYLKASSSPFRLGSANLQFKYKNTVLTAPQLEQNGLNPNYTGVTFTTPNLVGIASDDQLGSFNFEFRGGANTGMIVPSAGEGLPVAVIRFTVVNDNSPNIRTYENGSRGIVVYNDAPVQISRGECLNQDYNYTIAERLTSQTFCTGDAPSALQLSGTQGGTFSSQAGLTLNPQTGVITPTTSTPGNYQVYYTVPNAGGGQTMAEVVINPSSTVALTNLADAYCSSVSPFALSATPTGGTFTIDGATATQFNPSALASGPHIVNYTYTNEYQCTTTATKTILINQAPSITNGAASAEVCLGQPFQLNAAVAGSNLTFQWKKDNTPIAGANALSYGVANATTQDAGNYTLEISGCAPTPLTTTGIVVVNTPPAIAVAPTNTSACLGTTATLNVSATGAGLTYQWFKNNNPIQGATAATYTLNNLTLNDGATYKVAVTGTCAPAVTSSDAVLTIHTLPNITTQPISSTTICAGGDIQLSVLATGSALSYQWRKDGQNIANATNATYTATNVGVAGAGAYTVVVSGACTPSVTSEVATVVVNATPNITVQPISSTTICAGANTEISVTATGVGLSYQWKKNGQDIPNATNSNYIFENAVASQSGTYTVVVSGLCAPTVTSDASEVTINTPTTILAQPVNATVCVGGVASIGVSAAGSNLVYQWKKNGTDIIGANAAIYTISAAALSDAGAYTVAVNGSCGAAVSSESATLTVNALPSITTQPIANTILCVGAPLSLSVNTTGSGLTYQWRKNGFNIPNATNATYSVSSAALENGGTYSVVVDGTCANPITSVDAQVIVQAAPVITTQPVATQAACIGTDVTLSVAATGTSLSYQWKKGGVDIAGATEPTYTLNSVTAANAGTYQVVLGNLCQSNVLSTESVLNINELTAITTQPTASTTVCDGTSISLSVAATGTNLTYQWRKNGEDIANATTATYSIANPMGTHSGNYTVVVSGACEPNVTSNAAQVEIKVRPTIVIEPNATLAVCLGTSATLSASLVGSDLMYQWEKGGQNIVGATSASYQIATVSTTDAGSYRLTATNSCGTAQTIASVLSVQTAPNITTQPVANTTICYGVEVNLAVAATGTDLTYQWSKGGVPLVGANQATLNIAANTAPSTATYTVAIAGVCAPAVESNPANVEILALPTLVTDLATSYISCLGSPLQLSVVATGANISYQWYKNGNALAGQTNPNYALATTSATDAGNYHVVITGTCAPIITSNTIAVQIDLPVANIVGITTIFAGQTTTLTNATPGGTWGSDNINIATVASTGVVTGVSGGNVLIFYALSNGCGTDTAKHNMTILPNKITLNIKVYLEGAYNSTNQMMNNGLGTSVPLSQPYTSAIGFTHRGGTGGNESITNPNILTTSDENAIADWVFVELRDKNQPSTVLYTRSALVQRDGDIVEPDGVTALNFNDIPVQEYYVAVRHRNHLGFRTAQTIPAVVTPISLNFTNNTVSTFGIEALKLKNGVYVMYAGEADGNGVVNAVDLNAIWLLQNGNGGYLRSDFDLNGIVNAVDRNAFWLINNSRIEQLD